MDLMARHLSEDKRNALLDAATDVVARLGVGAPTAKVAAGAGVAEGTLFTYFATKDELLNQLYLAIKMDLRDAIIQGFPPEKSLVDRIRHIWNGYVRWGSAHPQKRKAMGQLAVSDRITDEIKKTGGEAFAEMSGLVRELAAGGPLRDQTPDFVAAIMNALAEVTMDFIAKEPAKAKSFTKAGFEAFCKAVMK
jgi:AcrR family transcriptional regulator